VLYVTEDAQGSSRSLGPSNATKFFCTTRKDAKGFVARPNKSISITAQILCQELFKSCNYLRSNGEPNMNGVADTSGYFFSARNIHARSGRTPRALDFVEEWRPPTAASEIMNPKFRRQSKKI
jgi:hypothetical protein